MLTRRLPYRFLVAFLIFSFILIVSFSIVALHNSKLMLKDMDGIVPLTTEQKATEDKYREKMVEDIISITFYVFVLAFVLSLFFSRKFLVPIKELYRGARLFREGKTDISVQVTSADELGEIAEAFNEMTGSMKRKAAELKEKDLYISAMLDPLWVTGEDNVIVDINSAFTRLFGYVKDEVVGTTILDFLDVDAEKAMRKQLQEKAWDEPYTFEISIISKAEGPVPTLVSASPLMEGGIPVGRIMIAKDFRRETSLIDALREEKEHSEAMMDSMADELLVVNRSFEIVKANLAARVNAGRDIKGEHCHEVFHKSEERCFFRGVDCPVKIVFETGKPFKTVHEHPSDGKRAFLEISAYPVKDARGEVMHVVEVMRDVTDSKKFEEEIEQKNRELTTLNSVSRALSQSLKAEDIFNNVLDRVVGLLGMDGGGIFFLDAMGRELRCEYHRGLSADFMRSTGRMRMGEDLPGRVAISGNSIMAPDISRDARGEKSVLKHSGVKGYAAFPVRGKEKLIGVFFVFSFNAHNFTPEEGRILNSISEMMGIAIENVRFYEKMRELYNQQKLRRAEEQKNVLKLTSMLAETPDLRGALASGLSLIMDSCRADFIWLLVFDGAGSLILNSASGGDVAEGAVVFPEGTSSIEGYSIEKKRPVILSGINAEAKFYLPGHLKIYDSACSIPLFIGDRALGAFSVYYRTLREPREEDIDFLQTVSSILAVALERARLYEKTIVEKELADTILNGIADGVMTIDTAGAVISMNRAAEGIVGLAPGKAAGAKLCDVFNYDEANTDLRWKLGECLEEAASGKTITSQADLVSVDGRHVPLMVRSAPVRDQRDNIRGVVYVLRDIGREKEIDRMKTEFVKEASHAFRTPLSAIIGMTEMIVQGEVSGERANDYLNTILEEGRRLSDIVSDLLDVAKIESGREILRERSIDFGALLKDMEKSFASRIEAKQAGFQSSVESGIIFKGDEEKLGQLLRNLIDNSLTYSDSGCSIEVAVGKRDTMLRIVVRDEGWGMTAEDLLHAGEKFYRGKSAARTRGTGLGLALCGHIAKLHGGALLLESRPGGGTTVVVELPIDREGKGHDPAQLKAGTFQ